MKKYKIDFNCTSLTGMCTLVKIHQTVTETVRQIVLYNNNKNKHRIVTIICCTTIHIITYVTDFRAELTKIYIYCKTKTKTIFLHCFYIFNIV